MDNNSGAKRLGKVATELNVGVSTIIEYLNKNGFPVDNPNAKIGEEAYNALLKAFHSDRTEKQESMRIQLTAKKEVQLNQDDEAETVVEEDVPTPAKEKEVVAEVEKAEEVTEVIPEQENKKPGLKIVGHVNLEKTKKEKEVVETVETKIETVKEEETVVVEPEKVVIEEVIVEAVEEKPETTVVNKTETTETPQNEITESHDLPGLKIVSKIDLQQFEKKKSNKGKKEKPKEEVVAHENIKTEEPEKTETTVVAEDTSKTVEEPKTPEEDDRYIKTQFTKLTGPKQVGTIDLKQFEKKPAKDGEKPGDKAKLERKKRARIQKKKETPVSPNASGENKDNQNKSKPRSLKFKKAEPRPAISEEDIDKHIKETLAQLQGSPKSKSSKYRRLKRDAVQQQRMEEQEEFEKDQSILKVNEFITVSELAAMMNVPAVKVIQSCMSLGLFVSLNQRLDAEAITIVASEFGFEVKFVSVEEEQEIQEEEAENPEDLTPRAPVVTVMGHVDHGKTSLLDYIRKSNIIAGESGGITQHIGAYEVSLEGRKIAFLDTPGHEAFTAMRARGAKITDVAIIVIAADDQVMPQTIEAINHARAAGVPMVFAMTKIDKAGANPEKIREQLAGMNLLVEEWGGKYQSQEVDAKHGLNIDKLLEKVLLEADILELKANANKLATGSVIESSLDKGRGYMATILVHAGTMRVGDVILAGSYYGRVKAMFNERNQPVKEAGPSTPVVILGLNGAPAAGDKLTCHADEKSAKDIALKRQQLIREQSLRTQKHITLDEIGRRIAIGDFKELNIIVKGDVDGSVEALADSLLKLSTDSVQVNVIHKAIGGITESDVLLATASNAIIIGFQVRPSVSARKLAENEQIDIRTYSVIYDAIEQVKDAIEGMLEPKIEEKVVASIEVREVFKITKLGTIAGCMVLDGKMVRANKIHLIRNGIVVHTGTLASLRRFKDDVKEVFTGQDCGIGIHNFNDVKVGDIIEAFTEIEVLRKL
ncbi:MAG: translation initiation factor IF-2 [Bacteroidetes bacterium HGW-Bacteroidetes-6]|jgi:translation initiation factor IF-2|nr:MAG: translation initiation factor IF-2 [Bacteroidetes bacterium HGW-Bacteroidetes-6]